MAVRGTNGVGAPEAGPPLTTTLSPREREQNEGGSETPSPSVARAGGLPRRSPRSEADGDGPLVGVLALQGAFVEHQAMLERIGARARAVRLPADLEAVDALVIPGGESTTIGKL